MTKAKIVMTIEHEYEIDPKDYLNAKSDKERLEIDIESIKQDPGALLELDDLKVNVSGELIEADDPNQFELTIVGNQLRAPVGD